MEPRTKKTITGLAPAFIAGTLAAAAASMLGSVTVAAPLLALVVAGVVVMAWRTAVVIERAAAEVALAAAKPVVMQRIAADRRRPTMDRESGLLADWYFRLRVEEEIARAQRYGQNFTLLRLNNATDDPRNGLALASRTCLRAIDLAGTVGNTAAILLPNTGKAAAETVVERLREVLPDAEITAAECPTDASTLAALVGEQEWIVNDHAEEQEAA